MPSQNNVAMVASAAEPFFRRMSLKNNNLLVYLFKFTALLTVKTNLPILAHSAPFATTAPRSGFCSSSCAKPKYKPTATHIIIINNTVTIRTRLVNENLELYES